MTDDEIDWHNPIPGNIRALQGEIDRLWELRDRFRDAAMPIRHLGLDGWRGPAADEFAAHRTRLARQWSDAELEHERWAGALADYRDVLLALQPLARDAVERANRDGDWTRAQADVERWRGQADSAAYRTSDVLRDVADRLRDILPLLTEPAENHQATPVAGPPPSAPRMPVVAAGDEPPAVHQSPVERRNRTAALCDALLRANFVSAEYL